MAQVRMIVYPRPLGTLGAAVPLTPEQKLLATKRHYRRVATFWAVPIGAGALIGWHYKAPVKGALWGLGAAAAAVLALTLALEGG